jgi:rhodanese-related sulfurtransferase
MEMYASQSAFEVYQRLQRNEAVDVIDVREIDEWQRGHIPQAKHIPLGELELRSSELNQNKETILVCHSGRRSDIACNYLHNMGYNVVNMTGGMTKWFWEVN